MTNKKCEGIDCAWCMSIECPNEKKTEMTDKEHNFVKDINVSHKRKIKCKYKIHDDYHFNGKPYCTCFNELCEDLTFACDHNCQIYEDYKQLALKTQECEELKEDLRLAKQLVDWILKTFNLESYDWLDDQNEISTEIENFLAEQEEENEELEKYAQAQENQRETYYKEFLKLSQECEQKEKELKELKRQYKLSCLDCEYKNTKADVDRYHKALEEIENNINKYFEEGFYKNCRYAKECTKACGLATNRVLNKTLDIINKAKGGKNENT